MIIYALGTIWKPTASSGKFDIFFFSDYFTSFWKLGLGDFYRGLKFIFIIFVYYRGLLYIYYARGVLIFIIFIIVGSFPKEVLCSHSTLSQSRKARNLSMTNPNFVSWGGSLQSHWGGKEAQCPSLGATIIYPMVCSKMSHGKKMLRRRIIP